MATGVLAATGCVLTVNVAVVAPAATVTEAGTPAAGLLVESVTTAPPAGAAPFRVTVPVAEPPPATLDDASDTDLSSGCAVTYAT